MYIADMSYKCRLMTLLGRKTLIGKPNNQLRFY